MIKIQLYLANLKMYQFTYIFLKIVRPETPVNFFNNCCLYFQFSAFNQNVIKQILTRDQNNISGLCTRARNSSYPRFSYFSVVGCQRQRSLSGVLQDQSQSVSWSMCSCLSWQWECHVGRNWQCQMSPHLGRVVFFLTSMFDIYDSEKWSMIIWISELNTVHLLFQRVFLYHCQ